jgi:hypothetical protein
MWVMYLTVALLFIQTTDVHMHVFDHVQEFSTPEHVKHNAAHFCDGVCDTVHDHESAVEIDLSPAGWIKFPSFESLLFVILTVTSFALLFLTRPAPQHWPARQTRLARDWRQLLRPPLRAPPR